MTKKPKQIRRLIPAFGLALVASLLLSALAAGSASASTEQWFSCENWGSGASYTDSACQIQGTGNYEWEKRSSASTLVSLKGSTPFVLSGTIALSKTTITCSTASAEAKVANPIGEAPGTLSTEAGTSLTLSGCSIEGLGTGCQIEGGSIKFEPLHGAATGEAGHVVKLEGESKTLAIFNIVKVEGKTCTAAKVTATGSVSPSVSSATSSIEFTEAGSSLFLKINGSTGKLTGTGHLERKTTGQALRLGPPTVTKAPTNLSPPTVSPSHPFVGEKVTAEVGKWTQNPTYTYQWSRCNSTGTECKTLTGSTGATYNVSAYDEGQTLAVEVKATNAFGSNAAVSAASAVVVPPASGVKHWYVCESTIGGFYSDSGCLKGGGSEGGYEWVQLTAGTPLSFTSSNTTPIKLSYEIGFNKKTIECSTEAGSGSVLNPVGGGAGTISGGSTLFDLTGCIYNPNPSKCTITGGHIKSLGVSGTTSGSTASFTTGTGTIFYWEESSGCLVGPTVTGTLTGSVNSLSSSLDFGSGSGNGLKFSGAKVYFEGSIQLNTTKGLLRFR